MGEERVTHARSEKCLQNFGLKNSIGKRLELK
jgi:hypothetical protein